MNDDTAVAKASNFKEIGVAGLKVWSGVTNEEYLRELTGARGTKIYRQMSASDPVIKAILRAIGLILRAVEWRVDPAPDTGTAGEQEAEFVESILDDMSHPFEDFISEALTFLSYGWAYHEIVLKRRVGPLESDPAKRSKFVDGRIGVRKLAPRAQDTLLRWEIQPDGGIAGLHQQPETGGTFFIPIERALLFRTESRKNNPEGESVLRAAYESWYHGRVIRNAESIGIERELAGLPVISIPARYTVEGASATEQAMFAKYVKIARDLKFNEQGGLVIPSDPYENADGTLSSMPQVKIELLSTGGRRQIDTSASIQRHQRDIARSVLADFIMLGSDSEGSYALSSDKSAFFMRACEAFLFQIAAPLNRFLLPRIWDYNGLDRALLPTIAPGSVASVDLEQLGTFIQRLAGAGAPLFPDPELEEHLRDLADLPPPSEEVLDMREERREAMLNIVAPEDEQGQGKKPVAEGKKPAAAGADQINEPK